MSSACSFRYALFSTSYVQFKFTVCMKFLTPKPVLHFTTLNPIKYKYKKLEETKQWMLVGFVKATCAINSHFDLNISIVYDLFSLFKKMLIWSDLLFIFQGRWLGFIFSILSGHITINLVIFKRLHYSIRTDFYV